MNNTPADIRPSLPIEVSREQVGAKSQELLGIQRIPKYVEFDKDEFYVEERLLFTRVTFPNSLGEAVAATVVCAADLPAARQAAVVCMPGMGCSMAEVLDPRLYRPKPESGPLLGFGRGLARRGYADELASLRFGYPSLQQLPDSDLFLVFWCVEELVTLIRWVRIQVDTL